MRQQLVLPGEIVKKKNDLIRTKLNLPTVQGARILATLISCLRVDDTYFEPISISAKEVLNHISGEHYKRVKSVITELASATVELELYEPDDPFPNLIACPFFQFISYKKGIITAVFNDRLYEFLMGLKENFTKYNLLEYKLLSSDYSQRIFEILQSYKNLPECKIQLSHLHYFLDTPESVKNNFKNFRMRVLEPVHKEIIKKTGFFYEWEPIKKGVGKTSPVTAIKFIFAKNRALPVIKNKRKTDKEKEEQKEKLFKRAFYCAEQKKGNCTEKNQPAYICKVCVKNKFCDMMIRSKHQKDLLSHICDR